MQIGKLVIKTRIGKELFWTDRAAGGRLYHIAHIGIYQMSHIQPQCRALTVTILWASLTIGWPEKTDKENQ